MHFGRQVGETVYKSGVAPEITRVSETRLFGPNGGGAGCRFGQLAAMYRAQRPNGGRFETMLGRNSGPAVGLADLRPGRFKRGEARLPARRAPNCDSPLGGTETMARSDGQGLPGGRYAQERTSN